MTSASTKRRHKRNAALFAEWAGVPIGQRVTVRRARGDVLKTVTESRAEFVNGKHAMIAVAGVPGNTRLDRVTLGWSPGPKDGDAAPYSDAPLPWNHRAEKEIQRLRVAMVHAMDDCEAAADHKGNPVSTKSVLLGVAARLKTALEKK